MSSTEESTGQSPTISQALHAKLDMPFDEAVDRVQLEHEIAGFETIATTRLDRFVEGVLEVDDVERASLIVVCHAQIAHDAMELDRALTGLLPCTTVVYEVPDDEYVHAHHVSATKAMRDLGVDVDQNGLDDIIELTGDRMTEVWSHVEEIAVDED